LEKYHLTPRIVNVERALKTIANVFLSGQCISGTCKGKSIQFSRIYYEKQGQIMGEWEISGRLMEPGM